MQELEDLRKEFQELSQMETEADEMMEMTKIISEVDKNHPEESQAEKKEIEEKISQMEKKLIELDKKTIFSGKYDRNNAIITIHSGAGGVDAQDWSEMLLRMYLRFAEKMNWKTKLLDESRSQEAGIKSATLEVAGNYVYGNLQGESGVHRLVRLSPFNSDNLRQTSFSLVEVLPVIPDNSEIEIKDADIRVDVFRSSGAGGQSVNTTDSAVRITHLESGLVVTCQNERSQLQNKEQALKILKARLLKEHLEKVEQEKNNLRGEKKSVEWGSQIRSYVLHPYKQVKDHRTGFETSQVEKVLEGDLEELIESYLRKEKK